jgi:hypothetical protein
MIAGRFEITFDELDELVEAIAMRTADRIAALLGHDPPDASADESVRSPGQPRIDEEGVRRPKRLR